MIGLAEKETDKKTTENPEVDKVENAECEAEKTAKASKKHDKKAEKENAELEQLKAELAKQKDLLLRTAAEFDNYKRRTEKESLAAAEYTKALMLKKLLPVFDNIERANAADKDSKDYAKGVEMTVKLLTEAVTNLGMVEIGAEGDRFDPSIHEAVMHTEDENFDENTVCKVLQKGYKIGDTVIRPAMVQVAN